MGLIAKILSTARVVKNKAKATDVKHNPGGGANLTSELFQPPGFDGMPLAGDYTATVSVQRSGGEAVVGTLDPKAEQLAGPGESRIYSRNSDGEEVAQVHVKADSSIVSSNSKGSTLLAADGSQTLTTPNGDNVFGTDGSVLFSNGARLTPDGDFITASGKSLDGHKHTGNLGSPTSAPI